MVGGISYKVAGKAQMAGLRFFINFALIVDALSVNTEQALRQYLMRQHMAALSA
jgi:hypothetical protein